MNLEDNKSPNFLLCASQTSQMSMVIEEWIYDLERDEEAMLKRIKETNLKATSVEGFLYSRVGGLGSLDKSKGP